MTGPRVLVTGSDGFVGRHVCRRFIARGWSVRGSRRSGPCEVREGIEYRASGDIAALPDWTPLLDRVSVVAHTAGRAHQAASDGSDPLAECRRVNVEATVQLARAAAARGVARFVHLSSLRVQALEAETQGRPAGAGAYALSKLEAEAALARVARESGLELVILRPPLVYGPGVGANFRKLMRAVEAGWPLPLASVENRRSFIFVGNLADAVATAAAHPGPLGGVFALSDGEAVSTPDLFRRVGAAIGRPVRLFPCPSGPLRLLAASLGWGAEAESLIGSLVADDRPFREATGWSPPFTMAEGVATSVRAEPDLA